MTKRIPADIYDALALSALVYGGIGAVDMTTSRDVPLCLMGHIDAIVDKQQNAFTAVLRTFAAPVGESNDRAVARINKRKGRDAEARVSWAEYVAERGWERGS